MKEEGSTKAIPLIGVWKLISFEVRREGEEPSFPFGRDAGIVDLCGCWSFLRSVDALQST